jgi:hypothetical protein
MRLIDVQLGDIARTHGYTLTEGARSVNQQLTSGEIAAIMAIQTGFDEEESEVAEGRELDPVPDTEAEIQRLLVLTPFTEKVLRARLCVKGVIVLERVSKLENCLIFLLRQYGDAIFHQLGANHLIETGAIIFAVPKAQRPVKHKQKQRKAR